MIDRPQWDLVGLRAHAKGRDLNVDAILDSIGRAVQIFRYHMITARDALQGIVDETAPEAEENYLLLFGVSSRQDEFSYARVVSEANIIGCMYSARNLWDLFAQVLNTLVLVEPLPIGACDINRVVAAMPDSDLRVRLVEILQSQWFKYVAAFSNMAKHRNLVEHFVSVSGEENRVGIRAGGFRYGKSSYPPYWGREVIQGAIEVKNGIVECGKLLNEHFGVDDVKSTFPSTRQRRAPPATFVS